MNRTVRLVLEEKLESKREYYKQEEQWVDKRRQTIAADKAQLAVLRQEISDLEEALNE